MVLPVKHTVLFNISSTQIKASEFNAVSSKNMKTDQSSKNDSATITEALSIHSNQYHYLSIFIRIRCSMIWIHCIIHAEKCSPIFIIDHFFSVPSCKSILLPHITCKVKHMLIAVQQEPIVFTNSDSLVASIDSIHLF